MTDLQKVLSHFECAPAWILAPEEKTSELKVLTRQAQTFRQTIPVNEFLGRDARLRAAASVLQLLKLTSSSLTSAFEVHGPLDASDDVDDDDD